MYFLNSSPQLKKEQFKIPRDALFFSQTLISALCTYAVLPLQLKRHPVGAGDLRAELS